MKNYYEGLFESSGITLEHDDNVPANWNYFWLSKKSISKKVLRVYIGAEYSCNLTNRNIHSVDGVLCLKSEDFEVGGFPTQAAFISPELINNAGYINFRKYLLDISKVVAEIDNKLMLA